MGFTDLVGRYQLARSEGLVLRYLTDAYRTLRQSVPDAHRTPELEELVEWLGETVRQTDSSLLDEWEALTDPDHAPGPTSSHHDARAAAAPDLGAGAGVPGDDPQRDVRAGSSWCARDDVDGLVRLERAAADRTDPPREVVMTRSAWDEALEEYYAEHDRIGTDGDARGPALLVVGAEEPGTPAGAAEDSVAGSGGCGRPWPTQRVTTTG